MSSPAQPTPAELQAESLARDISSEMPSPYCPGRSIASCPSSYARDLEDDILALAQQGQDREQIEMALVERFGEEKMGKPQQSEIIVALGLAALIALVVIVRSARKWLRPAVADVAGHAGPGGPGDTTASPLAKVSADELDRLEDELDELDGI